MAANEENDACDNWEELEDSGVCDCGFLSTTDPIFCQPSDFPDFPKSSKNNNNSILSIAFKG